MTTDLRAALREAAALLREDARDHIDEARKQAAAPLLQMAERLVALADAPPTVAERMPVTWFDMHRGQAYVLATLKIAGMTLDACGHVDPRTGAWFWTWRCDVGVVGSGRAPDEPTAKAAALAALDEWIAEIVDARRAVTP